MSALERFPYQRGVHKARIDNSFDWEIPFPLDSILDAVFTVSPNKQYLGIVIPTTPATTGPVTERKLSQIKPQGLSVLSCPLENSRKNYPVINTVR